MQKEHNPTRFKSKEVSACQSDKSAFEKKLSGETNTDYKNITDEKISINKNKQIYFSLFFYIDVLFKDNQQP